MGILSSISLNNDMIQFISVLTILLFYISWRINKVYKFKLKLCERSYMIIQYYYKLRYDPNNEESISYFDNLIRIWESINNISNIKMLFSFRSLKLSNWLSKEQINFLALIYIKINDWK